MRNLTTHRQGGFTTLAVEAIDPGIPGEPTYRYDITGFNTAYNHSGVDASGHRSMFTRLPIIFQKGPLFGDTQQNGVSVNALIAVLVDHLTSIQNTEDACFDYQMAVNYLQSAKSHVDRVVHVPYSSYNVIEHETV